MKNTRYILFLVLLLFIIPLHAQHRNDQIIFKAMQDELKRNLDQLSLPDVEKPFFISYSIGAIRQYEMQGVLGSITTINNQPEQMIGSVNVLLGDYTRTSDSKYQGRYKRTIMPAEADYDLIRQCLWLGTDAAFKDASKELAAKLTARQKEISTPEEARLTDLVKIQPVEKIIVPEKPFVLNEEQWQANLRTLSSIFGKYPELYNSSVTIKGMDMEVYLSTTEGTRVKQPVRYICLQAEASTRTDDGIQIKDSYSAIANIPDQLPDMNELKTQITEFAESLTKLRNAEPVTQFYCGPVLFEDGAAASILQKNLLTQNGLFAYRKPEDRFTAVQNKVKPINSRINMKIIDNRITVKSYSDLEQYDGKPLYGAYSIDAEGVVPPKELTLVEHGIFKKMLNGRVPGLNCEETTGSSKYYAYPREVLYTTAPGTLHISADKGAKPEMLKKQLIKMAKEDGLSYAYIVRSIDPTASVIYRVNVKDGKETLMRSADISSVELKNLRRLAGISAKEKVAEFMLDDYVLTSMIYPSALLVEDVEINKTTVTKESAPVLQFPLSEKAEK